MRCVSFPVKEMLGMHKTAIFVFPVSCYCFMKDHSNDLSINKIKLILENNSGTGYTNSYLAHDYYYFNWLKP